MQDANTNKALFRRVPSSRLRELVRSKHRKFVQRMKTFWQSSVRAVHAQKADENFVEPRNFPQWQQHQVFYDWVLSEYRKLRTYYLLSPP